MTGHGRSSAEAAPATNASLIVVVDEDAASRAGLVGMLEDAGFRAEGYGSFEEPSVGDLALGAACLLIRVGRSGLDGAESLERLGGGGVRVPVAIIATSQEAEETARAMRIDTLDLLREPVDHSDIVAAVERAVGRQAARPTWDSLRKDAERFMARLTPRQRDVLRMIIDGHANKNIAATLNISRRTVENHRADIMRKSGVKSLAALSRLMFAANVSPTPDDLAAGPRPALTVVGDGAASDVEMDRFERYFEQIPLAVVVARMRAPELVIYANPAFERLSGQSRDEVEGRPWSGLRGASVGDDSVRALGDAVPVSSDLIGTFRIDRPGQTAAMVEVFSNVIVDEDDGPAFRLAALVDVSGRQEMASRDLQLLIQEKDTRLLEIQHRVKNNLQMITALVRIEARKAQGRQETGPFDRLAGRINAIQLLYKLLSESGEGDEVDLGVYLSDVASSIMHASAQRFSI